MPTKLRKSMIGGGGGGIAPCPPPPPPSGYANANDSQAIPITKHQHRENLRVRANRASELGNFHIYPKLEFLSMFELVITNLSADNITCLSVTLMHLPTFSAVSLFI